VIRERCSSVRQVLVDARAWHAALADLAATEVELAARAAKLVARAAELVAREAERVVRDTETARLRNEATTFDADLQRLKRIDLKLERRR
jgi:N-acetylmuramic acid 6-phosphate (MurNAc-6-P) etherase